MDAGPSVQSLVLKSLPSELRKTTVGPDEDLVGEGRLDSMALMDLVSAIEEQFGVALTDDDLVVENFRTVRDIERLVASKHQAA